jgi:hypothetical protein
MRTLHLQRQNLHVPGRTPRVSSFPHNRNMVLRVHW